MREQLFLIRAVDPVAAVVPEDQRAKGRAWAGTLGIDGETPARRRRRWCAVDDRQDPPQLALLVVVELELVDLLDDVAAGPLRDSRPQISTAPPSWRDS